MTMKKATRVLCGIAGALLVAMAALLVLFLAAAAFGSYYDGPATSWGVIPGLLFTTGRHLAARCLTNYERRPLTVTIADYLGDALVAMGVIAALDGSWAHDAEASMVAMLLLFGGAAVYACAYLLPRIRRTHDA